MSSINEIVANLNHSTLDENTGMSHLPSSPSSSPSTPLRPRHLSSTETAMASYHPQPPLPPTSTYHTSLPLD